MSDRDHLLRLSVLQTHAPGAAAALARAASGGAASAFSLEELLTRAAPGRDSAPLERARAALREHPPRRVRAHAERAGLRLIYRGESDYPRRLRILDDAPPVLYAKGLLPSPERPWIAFVGSRRATERGRDAAQTLAASAACRGEVVVSGMAFGIDDAAHRGALGVDGITVAVLASGADLPSPRSQTTLYRRIVDGGGAVISHFLPGTPALPYRFPIRNWLIAALSDRVLVVEAGSKSGALHTVDHAQALGRAVLAYPGDGLSLETRGSNRLIQDGAEVVLGPEDLLRDQQLLLPLDDPSAAPRTGSGDHDGPEPLREAASLARALAGSPLPVDELAVRLDLEIAALRSSLGRLERAGLVRVAAGVAHWVPAPPLSGSIGP